MWSTSGMSPFLALATLGGCNLGAAQLQAAADAARLRPGSRAAYDCASIMSIGFGTRNRPAQLSLNTLDRRGDGYRKALFNSRSTQFVTVTPSSFARIVILTSRSTGSRQVVGFLTVGCFLGRPGCAAGVDHQARDVDE